MINYILSSVKSDQNITFLILIDLKFDTQLRREIREHSHAERQSCMESEQSSAELVWRERGERWDPALKKADDVFQSITKRWH